MPVKALSFLLLLVGIPGNAGSSGSCCLTSFKTMAVDF